MTEKQEIALRMARLLMDARDKNIVLTDKEFLENVFELITAMNKISPPSKPIFRRKDIEKAFRTDIEPLDLLQDTEESEAE